MVDIRAQKIHTNPPNEDMEQPYTIVHLDAGGRVLWQWMQTKTWNSFMPNA
jgi:hypothetical protein